MISPGNAYRQCFRRSPVSQPRDVTHPHSSERCACSLFLDKNPYRYERRASEEETKRWTQSVCRKRSVLQRTAPHHTKLLKIHCTPRHICYHHSQSDKRRPNVLVTYGIVIQDRAVNEGGSASRAPITTMSITHARAMERQQAEISTGTKQIASQLQSTRMLHPPIYKTPVRG